jgi:WD40 repeat protein/tRNA A-37 threonylcarbamoyl transferase component Bud32
VVDGCEICVELRDSLPDDEPSGRARGRSMHIQCPHCHNLIELAEDPGDDEIVCSTCGSSFRLEPESTAGWNPEQHQRRLGKFLLIDALGVGAFGTVYKARDTELDRIVAIKVPRLGRLATRTELDRFMREARVAAHLEHPSIVSVYDVGVCDGVPFLVSEFISGTTLADQLSARRLSFRESAELIAKAADALDYAHQQGVIHRDVKPANIMIDVDGSPRLMDFGLAKRETGEVTMTIDGQVLGTPAYISPEQAAGDTHRVDRRTDIYSLGVILYLLITGELPFRGTKRMLLHQVLHDEPRNPRRINEHIPRDLETVCLKAMAKEPNRRYQRAADLAADLRKFLVGEPILARPVSRLERWWRWSRRNPVVAGLTGAIAMLLIAVAVTATIAALGFRSLADRQAITVNDMFVSLGLAAAEKGELPQAVLWFANAAELAPRGSVREHTNRVRVRTWSRELPVPYRAFAHEQGWPTSVAFSADGRFLLVQTGDDRCTLWDVEAGRSVLPPVDDQPVACAAFDPTGRWLAVGASSGAVELICVVPDPGVGDHRVELPVQSGPVGALAFSRDGRWLAVAGNSVRVWDFRAGAFLTAELSHPAKVFTVTFNHRGDRLVTTCADGKARVYAVPGDSAGKPIFEPVVNLGPYGTLDGHPPIQPTFIDDDRELITLTDRATLTCWNTQTGEPIRDLWLDPTLKDTWLVLESPNRRRFVVCGFPSVQIWDVGGMHPIGELMRHQNHVYHAAFSPDGRILLTVSADRKARLWDADTGQPISPPLPHQNDLMRAAFSPDGRRFATAQNDGLVRVWDLGLSTEPRAFVPLHSSESFVQSSADGRFALPVGWNYGRDATVSQVYDLSSRQVAGPPLSADGFVNAGALSPTDRRLVLLTSTAKRENASGVDQLNERPGRIQFWDWHSGQRIGSPLATMSEPVGAAYHPASELVAVICAAGQILLLDCQTQTIKATTDHGAAFVSKFLARRYIAFSPDGHNFLSWGLGNTVRVWDTDTAKLHCALEHGDVCKDVAFSPDGRTVATASADKTVGIWSLETGQPRAEPLPHPDWVFSACFSPDGRHVLTACRDGMARLWDWRSGKLVCPALEHEDEVFGVTFSPNGRWLFTCGRDKTARVWEWATGKLVAPPIRLPGEAYEIRVTPDCRTAVVAGRMPALYLLDLCDLDLLDPKPYEHSVYDLRLFAEVLSGQAITQGGGLLNLTTDEWVRRWRELATRSQDGTIAGDKPSP